MRNCDYGIRTLGRGSAGRKPAHAIARLRCRERHSDNSLRQPCTSLQQAGAGLLVATHLFYPAMMQSNRFVADRRMKRQLTADTHRPVQQLLPLRGTHG